MTAGGHGDREAACHFTSAERLVADFLTAVYAIRCRRW
jgi:hypothetical protein